MRLAARPPLAWPQPARQAALAQQRQQQWQQRWQARTRGRTAAAAAGGSSEASPEDSRDLSDSELEDEAAHGAAAQHGGRRRGASPERDPVRRALQLPLEAAATLAKEDAHYLQKRQRSRWWRRSEFPRVPADTIADVEKSGAPDLQASAAAQDPAAPQRRAGVCAALRLAALPPALRRAGRGARGRGLSPPLVACPAPSVVQRRCGPRCCRWASSSLWPPST